MYHNLQAHVESNHEIFNSIIFKSNTLSSYHDQWNFFILKSTYAKEISALEALDAKLDAILPRIMRRAPPPPKKIMIYLARGIYRGCFLDHFWSENPPIITPDPYNVLYCCELLKVIKN